MFEIASCSEASGEAYALMDDPCLCPATPDMKGRGVPELSPLVSMFFLFEEPLILRASVSNPASLHAFGSKDDILFTPIL